MRIACLLALFAAAASAKPPAVAGSEFVRLDDLEKRLAHRAAELRAAELFAQKPRVEKLILRLRAGDKEFEGKELTARFVVEEVFDWEELEKHPPAEETVRILSLLPEALKSRFDGLNISKKDRSYASRELVNALDHKLLHVRKVAIDSLAAMYSQTRGYTPDMPAAQRKSKKKEWSRVIKKLNR